jgi:hypothetical protein
MSALPFVIITTQLPPNICGVGTYSWLLHEHWPGGTIGAQFLVVKGAAASARTLAHPAIAEFNSKPGTLARELKRIGAADVLLHYAGRAYHRYGCPWWLPSVLGKWKKNFPSARLMILFHELPGHWPITSRHYWIDMCNGRVISKLSMLADVIITNTSDHAKKLNQIPGGADIHWFPVPSNIPAPKNVSAKRLRSEFVIFGLPFGRWQTLQMFDTEIRSWRESGHLTKLHLIGPRDEKIDVHANQWIQSWPDPGIVTRHGMLPAADVSRLLNRAQFGLANASVENWSKSAVFMAFASHGCSVVTKITPDAAPLCFTVTPPEVAALDDVDLNKRAQALQEWYWTHADWDVVAKKISGLLPVRDRQKAPP